jgi:hypothetical protein
MQHVLETALERGLPVHLTSTHSAEKFYEKLGFTAKGSKFVMSADKLRGAIDMMRAVKRMLSIDDEPEDGAFTARAPRVKTKDFNPDQPRDEGGRWTSDGGGEENPQGGGIMAADVGQGSPVDPGPQNVLEHEAEAIRLKILGLSPSTAPSGDQHAAMIKAHTQRMAVIYRRINGYSKDAPKTEEERAALVAERERLKGERADMMKRGAAAETEVTQGRELDREDAWEAIAPEKPMGEINVGTHARDEFDDLARGEAVDFLRTVAAEGCAPTAFRSIYRGSRAHASPDADDLYMQLTPGDADPQVVVHEYGHLMETSSPAHLRAATEFLERRAGAAVDDKPTGTKLSRLQPSRGYGDGERTWEDKFLSPYTGKIYKRSYSGAYYATEITSMGLQNLYRDPAEFAKRDPDHFRFTIAQLRRKQDK